MLSASIVGTALGLLGIVMHRWVPQAHLVGTLIVVGVAVTYGVAEFRGGVWPVPTRHWQVPRGWGRFGRVRYATLFGLLLGPGFFTIVPFVGYYLLLINCVLTVNVWYGTAAMALFGATRAAPLVLAPLFFQLRGQAYTFESAVVLNEWFVTLHTRLEWLRGAVLFAVAGSAVATGLRWLMSY